MAVGQGTSAGCKVFGAILVAGCPATTGAQVLVTRLVVVLVRVLLLVVVLLLLLLLLLVPTADTPSDAFSSLCCHAGWTT